MLTALSIRDIVLIEALDLEFGPGLNILTGETGAGKSILLDALGFALGRKTRRDLLRAGAPKGSVTASFRIGEAHPVQDVLSESDLDLEDDELVLRRTIAADGPSRAFANDQRISAETLRQMGEILVEVHGQHDDRGLLNPRAHRPLLDAFADLDLVKTRQAWQSRQTARQTLETAREAVRRAAEDADFLRHATDELSAIAPMSGEDAELDSQRRLMKQAEKIRDEVAEAARLLSSGGSEGMLNDALLRLSYASDQAQGQLDIAIESLDRAMTELGEAQRCVNDVLDVLSFSPDQLELVEERLFAIRGLARKHNVLPDDLPALAEEFSERLTAIDAGEDQIASLEVASREADRRYEENAKALHKEREVASKALDQAVTQELLPLKMENARFETVLAEISPGPSGWDAVSFTAAINPGAPPGAIDRIASGGELSRFLLALKVCLTERNPGRVMVFDEIDRGVGGATADAVGRRLSRLSSGGQVLVVTHSPQVAAYGNHHWQITKTVSGKVTRTDVVPLNDDERMDEIARMLSGDVVTSAARSAAKALMEKAK